MLGIQKIRNRAKLEKSMWKSAFGRDLKFEIQNLKLLLVSNKKLAYAKTSHYLTIISLFLDYVQRFFVDKPACHTNRKQNAKKQDPGRSAHFFVQKTSKKREKDDRHGDGIAEIPGKAQSGKLFVWFSHVFALTRALTRAQLSSDSKRSFSSSFFCFCAFIFSFANSK